VFLLLPASVSCFSFSSSASSGGDVVVDGGLRWHWWLQTVSLLYGGGQCLLLFDLPVCGEAQASSSSSRVLQQGEEDGEKLTVVLVTGWAVVLLRPLFLFSSVSALLLIFVSVTLLLSFFFCLFSTHGHSLYFSPFFLFFPFLFSVFPSFPPLSFSSLSRSFFVVFLPCSFFFPSLCHPFSPLWRRFLLWLL